VFSGTSEGGFTAIPVPQLLAWVWDSHSKTQSTQQTQSTVEKKEVQLQLQRKAVAASLLRCLGRMAVPLPLSLPPPLDVAAAGGGGESGLQGQAPRRLLVNATSEEAIQIFVEALGAYLSTGINTGSGSDDDVVIVNGVPLSSGLRVADGVLARTVSVSLWMLLQQSEQARALVRSRLQALSPTYYQTLVASIRTLSTSNSSDKSSGISGLGQGAKRYSSSADSYGTSGATQRAKLALLNLLQPL
jgi:hypothetical protein